MTIISSLTKSIYESLNFFFSMQKLVSKFFFFPVDLVLAFHTRCFLPCMWVILGQMLTPKWSPKSWLAPAHMWSLTVVSTSGPSDWAISSCDLNENTFMLGLFSGLRAPSEDTANLSPRRCKPDPQNAVFTISSVRPALLIFTQDPCPQWGLGGPGLVLSSLFQRGNVERGERDKPPSQDIFNKSLSDTPWLVPLSPPHSQI